MFYRLIAAKWADGLPPKQGFFTEEELRAFNEKGYNCYFFPNHPSKPVDDRPVNGTDIDVFSYCFVDLDMKDYMVSDPDRRHEFATKEQFIEKLKSFSLKPSTIVDSGGGIHAYWHVADLDGMSFLRLQRRLARFFTSDPAVSKLAQLMRIPGTLNVKQKDNPVPCDVIDTNETLYTCEDMDKALPKISVKDEEYCKRHFESTMNPGSTKSAVSEELPTKFKMLLTKNEEIKKLFYGPVKDRSSADFRLGHLLFANGLTKEETNSVLVNTSKAVERSKVHRDAYASNITEKVWAEATNTSITPLNTSVNNILKRHAETPKNTRIKCYKYIDGTASGFRLTEVLGIVGKQGNGKTTWALNIFKGFISENPDYIHLFVSLEQPEEEIASRWINMCNGDASKNDKVHILGNYNEDGTYRRLTLKDIEKYVFQLQQTTGVKVGCVVIDYIAILGSEIKGDDLTTLQDNCMRMKSFAITTNTFLVMLSQSARGKGGNGDVELDADAAYGTSKFENFVDYMMTTWQPLKRVYDEVPHLKITAYKMCKIRKFNLEKDKIKKDTVYALMYSSVTEEYREITKKELDEYNYWVEKATDIRNSDRSKNPVAIKIMDYVHDGK